MNERIGKYWCPVCKKFADYEQVEIWEYTCDECGKDIKNVGEDSNGDVNCPHCGANDVNEEVQGTCPHCGHSSATHYMPFMAFEDFTETDRMHAVANNKQVNDETA
ncbi:MAG: hypothetical protein GY841_16505 [FCB group bacterium]|nr:hypothetical protein [FCB group bacterium]